MTAPQTTTTQEPAEYRYEGVAHACRPLRQRFNVDLREFVVLAVIYESQSATPSGLSAALELSCTSIDYCLDRLLENGLLAWTNKSFGEIATTFSGRRLIRNALNEFAQARQRIDEEALPESLRDYPMSTPSQELVSSGYAA
ncbi:MAG: MarR family transcriptional regulator [Woeseiaceae bacterium]